MEGGNSQEESRHGSADGNSDRQRPNVGPRNKFFSRGRAYRGGFSSGGPRPPLLNMFNHLDARSYQNGPGNNKGNMRHFPDSHFDRNQRLGGIYNPNACYNFNNASGNNFPMYNHNMQQQQQQCFINQNYNYPQHRGGRNGNWREGREDPRARDNSKEYDPELLKLLEEEGLYQLKKKSMKYPRANFFCRLCQSPCDEPDNCLVHIKSNRHQKLATVLEFDEYLRNLPLPGPAMLEAIEEVLETTAEQQGMSPAEKQERERAVQDLVTRLQERAPDAQLELIGSTYSGLALKTSDVNVALTVPDNVSPFHSIMELKQLIEECPHYTDVSNDLRSSFPSLSYTSSEHGGCRVVVGMGSPSMTAMARLMAVYASMDERFVVLARALRYWAQLCHVSDQRSGNMPAIAYTVMVVHFLQQTSPAVLPILRHLVPSQKPEEFPLPHDIENVVKSSNKQSVGELWHQMLHYYAHDFNFAAYNVNVIQITLSKKDKAYSKKVSIEDPFNPKRNLTRTVSNSAVFEFIIDRLFKVLCRYFSVPQLSYGQLFYTLTHGNTLLKEKRTNNCSLIKSSGKKVSSESENEKNQSTELDQALERLSNKESSVDSLDDDASKSITSPDDLESTFDTITIKEANRIMNLLNKEHFKFEFNESKFTEGESVPIFCSSCQQEGHTREDCEDEKLPPLLPLGDINPSHIQLLSDILVKLRGEMEPSPEEMNLRDSVVNTLQYHIENEPKYRDALLQLFGSSANGFGFAYSDLDVCITFKNGDKEHFDQSFLIQDLARILRQSRAFTEVFTIPTAKVPIVKFRCVETQLEGDLSLYNTLGVHNTRLLWTYSVIDPRVKVLGHSLKYFAKRCDIGDASRGSLSSYAFTLLLIHFLQQCEPPVVPVLQKLYDPADPPKPVMVEGWNTWFYSDLKNLASVWPELGSNKCSVGELFIQLFRYYTETFDFEENIVTIRQKKPLMRLEKLWNNHGIAIEDPFDLSHNLGGALSRKMNTFILKAFINGRHLYGGVMKLPFGLKDRVQFLFDPKQLTAGAPPNDRGCHRCRNIGHHMKNCPQRGNTAAGDENKRKKDQHRKGGNQMHDGDATKELDTRRPNSMQERLAASGNAPAKKRDDKALLGGKGVDKIAEIVPEGTIQEEVQFSEVVRLLTKMLGSELDRVDILVLGYRIYSIDWFMSVKWKDQFTLLVPDVLLENKEPLVLVKIAERPYGRTEQDYVFQFLKHRDYFEEYLVDLNVHSLAGESTSCGLFRKGLTDLDQARKQKLEEKRKIKKEQQKIHKEQLKNNNKKIHPMKPGLVQATKNNSIPKHIGPAIQEVLLSRAPAESSKVVPKRKVKDESSTPVVQNKNVASLKSSNGTVVAANSPVAANVAKKNSRKKKANSEPMPPAACEVKASPIYLNVGPSSSVSSALNNQNLPVTGDGSVRPKENPKKKRYRNKKNKVHQINATVAFSTSDTAIGPSFRNVAAKPSKATAGSTSHAHFSRPATAASCAGPSNNSSTRASNGNGGTSAAVAAASAPRRPFLVAGGHKTDHANAAPRQLRPAQNITITNREVVNISGN